MCRDPHVNVKDEMFVRRKESSYRCCMFGAILCRIMENEQCDFMLDLSSKNKPIIQLYGSMEWKMRWTCVSIVWMKSFHSEDGIGRYKPLLIEMAILSGMFSILVT